jgi:hypothetical protein
MITIGVDIGGPEIIGTPIDRSIMAAMRGAITARGNCQEGSVPAVNVVFFTPGSVGGLPDWDHGRVVKYSAKRKLLLVQVAVPEEMVRSKSALDYVIKELYGANALAFEFYRQKGIDFALADAEKLVAEIRRIAAAEVA